MQKENSSALTVGSVYKLFRSALRGDAQDYTTGSIRRAVFMLAIPMILEMGMESVFAVVDLYFVGKLPDSQHNIQTVGLTESVLSLVYALAIGISMAATAMVARRVGGKRYKGSFTCGNAGIMGVVRINRRGKYIRAFPCPGHFEVDGS